MTTIAWDGKSMASDRQVTVGSIATEVTSPKIVRLTYHGLPAVVGRSGTYVHSVAVVDWLRRGAPADDKPDMGGVGDKDSFTVMVASENGVFLYVDSLLPVPLGMTRWALGTGADFALGAMDAGASAKKAVEIAIGRDINSGFGVDLIPLRGKQ